MSVTRILAGMLFAAMPAVAGEGQPFAPPGDKVLGGLGIEQVECAAEEDRRFPDHVAAVCGTTGQPFKSLRKVWRKAARRGALANLVRWDGSPWRDSPGGRKTVYAMASGLPLALSLDPVTGTVAVRWPESYPGCHDGFEFDWYTASPDILGPETRKQEFAEFPEKARVQRTGGTVIGSYLLDTKGRVVDVCVVAAHPPGLGFEPATVEAYMRSRYGPASRNGEPVAFAAPATMEFDINGGMNWSSVLAQAWFESVEIVTPPEGR